MEMRSFQNNHRSCLDIINANPETLNPYMEYDKLKHVFNVHLIFYYRTHIKPHAAHIHTYIQSLCLSLFVRGGRAAPTYNLYLIRCFDEPIIFTKRTY